MDNNKTVDFFEAGNSVLRKRLRERWPKDQPEREWPEEKEEEEED